MSRVESGGLPAFCLLQTWFWGSTEVFPEYLSRMGVKVVAILGQDNVGLAAPGGIGEEPVSAYRPCRDSCKSAVGPPPRCDSPCMHP
jgi:hypothetical protein